MVAYHDKEVRKCFDEIVFFFSNSIKNLAKQQLVVEKEISSLLENVAMFLATTVIR